MNLNGRRLFSSKQEESGSITKDEEKFELISCPLNGKFCGEIRPEINRNYAEAVNYRKSKDFDRSIESFKKAFYQTLQLPESPCSKCSAFFRSTITEAVKNLHKELKNMTTGLFKTTRYEPSRKKAEKVLQELKTELEVLKSAV